MPLISICIPTFNGQQHLEETLNSVANQVLIDKCEILIVDDGSNDDTLFLVNKFKHQQKRLAIRVVQNNENKGLVENWNECIKLAKGDWIKFQFQDDLMANDCIEKMYKAVQESNTDLVLCDREYFWNEKISSRKVDFLSNLPKLSNYIGESRVVLPEEIIEILKRDFIASNFLGEPIIGMFKKDLAKRFGYFDNSLKQICDFEYWLRLSINVQFYYLDDPLVKFRVHTGSQTFKNSKSAEIKTSHQDRMKLGSILLNNKNYLPLIRSKNRKVIYRKYINILLKYRKSYGLLKMIVFWKNDWSVLRYILRLVFYKPQLLIYDIYKGFRKNW